MEMINVGIIQTHFSGFKNSLGSDQLEVTRGCLTLYKVTNIEINYGIRLLEER